MSNNNSSSSYLSPEDLDFIRSIECPQSYNINPIEPTKLLTIISADKSFNSTNNSKFLPNKFHSNVKLKISSKIRKDQSELFQSNMNEKNINYALRYIFGKDSFRPKQNEIINACISGRDVFACIQTGGGKSLTFQISAFTSSGLTLVFMPLISLIQDQVLQLEEIKHKIQEFLKKSDPSNVQRTPNNIFLWCKNNIDLVISSIKNNSLKLLFITPEMLNNNEKIRNVLRTSNISRIVIDECHVVSSWGHDFRPDYKKLSTLRETLFPNTPILALTATAPEEVREDVIQILNMKNVAYFQNSYNRQNLAQQVVPKPNIIADLNESIVTKIKTEFANQSGIVQCLSRNSCEEFSSMLNRHNIASSYFHAKMQDEEKSGILRKWIKNEIKVVVATIAFGMGINKPDVRFVIHRDLPKSVENYQQESGRAGRDGLKSTCIMYYRFADLSTYVDMLDKYSTNNNLQLRHLIKVCEYAESYHCRRKYQVEQLGEPFEQADCKRTCDQCISKANGCQYSQKDQIFEFNLINKALVNNNNKSDYTQNTFINLLCNDKRGNKYFLNLPRIEVEKLVSTMIIEEWIIFKQKVKVDKGKDKFGGYLMFTDDNKKIQQQPFNSQNIRYKHDEQVNTKLNPVDEVKETTREIQQNDVDIIMKMFKPFTGKIII